jgi:hypothetical protein
MWQRRWVKSLQGPVWRKESQKWPLTEVDTHTMDVLKPLLMQLENMAFNSEILIVNFFFRTSFLSILESCDGRLNQLVIYGTLFFGKAFCLCSNINLND